MKAIDVKNMSFGYHGKAEIFDDVSFAVAEGEFVSIIGPNGGGKTTLVKLFLGLLEPTDGEIEIFGMSPRQASNKIGYLAQDPGVDINFPATVLDIVRMGRVDSTGFLGMGGADSKHSAVHALEAVGMDEFRNTPFVSLSGGQRQRVLIARALAAQAKMLLFDEPTSNLDVQVGRDFYNLMHDLNKNGMTILVVSHDKEFVSEYVKKVICVHHKVAVHPTTEWDVEMEADLYGGPMRRVMHNHDCLAEGCAEGEHR